MPSHYIKKIKHFCDKKSRFSLSKVSFALLCCWKAETSKILQVDATIILALLYTRLYERVPGGTTATMVPQLKPISSECEKRSYKYG